MDFLKRVRWPGLTLLALSFVLGCRPAPALTGVVEETASEEARILISRDPSTPGEVPESAWLAVSDPALLSELVPGQRVAYRLRGGGGRPEVASLAVRGWASEEEGWIALPGGRRVRAQIAPAFRLEDQDGRPAALGDWRGGLVLVDFIYTRCPGPCPAQTQDLVSVQRGLSERARAQVNFASVTLEPEFDDGPILRAYAEAHGADLSDWSFLTGDPQTVEAVARAWGIGASMEPDGSIGHTLHSFLVDGRGYVVARYSSRDRDPDAIRQEIELFAQAAEPGPAGPAR